MKFISVGYGNIVSAERVISVATASSAPAKRLIQDAKDCSCCIDCTNGRKTKSVIVMDSSHVVLSSLHTSTILARLRAEDGMEDDDEELMEEGN